MIVNIMTIARRKVHYIERTLESLWASDGRHLPVNLILGSFDTSHIERFKKFANIVRWDQEAQWQSKEGRPFHNFNVNEIRALSYGDDDHCVVCEDDVILEKDWYSRLAATVAAIDRSDYVLSLGQETANPQPGKSYAIHEGGYLCGSQAIFYPTKAIRCALANFIRENIDRSTGDHLIGRFAKQRAALYNTVPILAHHIGDVSAHK